MTELNDVTNLYRQVAAPAAAPTARPGDLSPVVEAQKQLIDQYAQALKDRDQTIIQLAKSQKPSALRKLVEAILSLAGIIAIATAK